MKQTVATAWALLLLLFLLPLLQGRWTGRGRDSPPYRFPPFGPYGHYTVSCLI